VDVSKTLALFEEAILKVLVTRFFLGLRLDIILTIDFPLLQAPDTRAL
jgi:hypothetical protein